MVGAILSKKPDDPIPYMIQYLEDLKGTGAKPLSNDEKEELERLRRIVKKQGTKIQADDHSDNSSE